ncbi:hypothetical protein, partial [Roseobacter sinensis]
QHAATGARNPIRETADQWPSNRGLDTCPGNKINDLIGEWKERSANGGVAPSADKFPAIGDY